MKDPPEWTRAQLGAARDRAESEFATKRRSESLETYEGYFDQYRDSVQKVLAETLDLREIRAEGPALLPDAIKSEVIRYLCGPPISSADLEMLVRAKKMQTPGRAAGAARLGAVIEVVRRWHDRRRFPWVSEGRPATDRERSAAVLATTALLAMRRTETHHRMRSSEAQEMAVERELRDAGFRQVPRRTVSTVSDAPSHGEFCRESLFGSRKADFLVGLWDGRTMAIECKVSSSAVNSIKRLNNDAAVKATVWRSEFGTVQVVAAALLDGVFALKNLLDAQAKGLTIFWAHDLAAMTDWIHRTSGDDAR